MKLLKYLMTAIIMLSLTAVNAQIKNAKTASVKIYGNCDACKNYIEKAGNIKKIARVEWNQAVNMAMLTYNSKKTNQEEILKRIAIAGFDSDQFLAPEEAYAKLPACCQYERIYKPMAKMEAPHQDMVAEDHSNHDMEKNAADAKSTMEMAQKEQSQQPKQASPSHDMAKMDAPKEEKPKQPAKDKPSHDMTKMDKPQQEQPKQPVQANPSHDMTKMDKKPQDAPSNHTPTNSQSTNQLEGVFDHYFAIKDALVKSNGEVAAAKAKALTTAIEGIKMESLKNEEMTVWMKTVKHLAADAKLIANTKDIAAQRKYFISLSANMYALMKVAKAETPVYYQFCPMANEGKGANWLSKENTVKNPYYGSQMLSCGKTVETIKQ